MKTSTAILAVAALLCSVSAHPEFRQRIPNSLNVPGVDAIGHVNTEGGGPRNKFGLDFAAAGLSWTKELCEKDSDGDGQTNGQELGDPCCAWVQTSNAKVLWTTGVSAPGDASKKSDPTLWASVSCAAGGSSNSTGSSSNSTGSTVTIPSSTTAAPAAAKSNSTSTTPAPTTTKSGATSVATLAFTTGTVALVSAIFA